MKKLTVKQAAEKLDVNDSRVRQLIGSGKLPAEKYGNLWLIDEKDLELVKDRKPTGRPPKNVSGYTEITVNKIYKEKVAKKVKKSVKP